MLARENQSLEEHLENVAILTQKHLNKTPYYSLGYILGKAHDLGKKLDEWQHYLQNSLNGISQRKIDHSTAGSQFIFNLYKGNVIGKILSHVIASHHSGLLNSTGNVSLNSRLQKNVNVPGLNITPVYDIDLLNKPSKFSLQFLIRILFSSLIDADRLDAEKCENINRIREEKYSLEELYDKFFNNIEIMQRNCIVNEINKIRKELYDQCIEKSYMKPGFFTMTIPTGGGKTLSSTAFSFNHSKQNNQDRIIYLAPYLSITEQNAQVLRDFTFQDAILEHHSNFDSSND